ncbi:uncharacterized protein LAESUDRAFT_761433 [Laetiporus sulphureus 93-53]|uniref:Uncharacterized protein n=1 Tax=Laetiporus sulphureus 93-53 TaxID=1314785 RepID=A0A165D3C1_9APHY|nr:uncharacterized protein LAESUDRAFT_761433 [Laetiporus sulphureus 93-53]KZT04077.1 hypothetical protein LAESUDRAFT_761433 [Laetiporus sulphureus 93-53]
MSPQCTQLSGVCGSLHVSASSPHHLLHMADTVALNRSRVKALPMKISPQHSTSSPRKTPHCKTCQRSRAGHPRSGCPYTDSLAPGINSLEALQIDSSIDEKHGRQPSKSPVPHTSIARDDSPPWRPSTPKAEQSHHTAKACSLGHKVGQDEQHMFFDRARLTLEGSVVILKHPKDGIADLLAEAKTVGLAAEVIGSLGKNSRLVVFGRDGELLSKVGHVGGSKKEAVDKVCENEVKKGCYSALVVGGAGTVVGAVATWMALAFL